VDFAVDFAIRLVQVLEVHLWSLSLNKHSWK